uniref:Uncharacterized protein n=1 Tax=Utricularia reniformis TaxID=192314 RepID=A0A1Y0B4L6_9LAMI|nr:hypothetical protein AEK19_MT2186 [Utricularia reniformis]ART32333.1 hypothetical protein AEK19_MT2186 [Utricularia reniformis]
MPVEMLGWQQIEGSRNLPPHRLLVVCLCRLDGMKLLMLLASA